MPPRLEAAFSLIEQMIALTILSIGLLGAAGLFSEALLQLHSNASQRAFIMLGEDFADQLIAMRSHTAHLGNHECLISTGRCFTDPQLEHLLRHWHSRLQAVHSNAHAELRIRTERAVQTCVIEIRWPDRVGTSHSHQTEFRLRR